MTLTTWLKRVLVVILAVSAIVNASGTFEYVTSSWGSGKDEIAAWEQRLTKLKNKLPIEQGVIGYLGDFDVEGAKSPAADQLTEYVLAQYSMAPIVLERNTGHEWMVGNLSPEAYRKWLASTDGEYEIMEYGLGIYLIHRLGQ